MKKVSISLWGRCLTTYPSNADWEFPKFLSDLGLDIVPLGDQTATHYVAMDHSESALTRVAKLIPAARRMLFVFEPEAVNPNQYKLQTRRKYGVSIIGSSRHRRMPSDRLIRLGTLPNFNKFETALANGNRSSPGSIGILNENKFSFTPKNLYKFRWNSIVELSKSGFHVDLGGKNWEKGWFWHLKQQLFTLAATIRNFCAVDFSQFHGPLPRQQHIRLHGRVESELDFLAKFEYSLVIENDPDYVSEKLFNAVMAGTVPLYVGPPLQEFEIPTDIAVQLDPAPGCFTAAVESLTEVQKSDIRAAGRSWFQSPGTYEKWSHAAALKTMADEISLFLQNH